MKVSGSVLELCIISVNAVELGMTLLLLCSLGDWVHPNSWTQDLTWYPYVFEFMFYKVHQVHIWPHYITAGLFNIVFHTWHNLKYPTWPWSNTNNDGGALCMCVCLCLWIILSLGELFVVFVCVTNPLILTHKIHYKLTPKQFQKVSLCIERFLSFFCFCYLNHSMSFLMANGKWTVFI